MNNEYKYLMLWMLEKKYCNYYGSMTEKMPYMMHYAMTTKNLLLLAYVAHSLFT
jgi:hypothetical protein